MTKQTEQTGSTMDLFKIQTTDTSPVHDIMHRQRANFLLLFLSSASYVSKSFPILSPCLLLV